MIRTVCFDIGHLIFFIKHRESKTCLFTCFACLFSCVDRESQSQNPPYYSITSQHTYRQQQSQVVHICCQWYQNVLWHHNTIIHSLTDVISRSLTWNPPINTSKYWLGSYFLHFYEIIILASHISFIEICSHLSIMLFCRLKQKNCIKAQ